MTAHELTLAENLDDARSRIKRLEAELRASQVQLLDAREQLAYVQQSNGWKILEAYYAVRNRLFPLASLRYRLAVAVFGPMLRFAKWLKKLPQRRKSPAINAGYAHWIAINEPDAAELGRQRGVRFPHEPHFCFFVPANDVETHGLARQTYSNCECWRDLQLCRKGDWIGVLRPGDVLSPDALFEMATAINQNPDADFLYSDEDAICEHGRRDPLFKPDWSPDYLRSQNYIGNLFVCRNTLMDGIAFDGTYDLILQLTERARKIVHVPKVLCHANVRKNPNAPSDARQTLVTHLARQGEHADVRFGPQPETAEIRYRHAVQPLLSIIIPNQDQPETLAACIRSIECSSYGHYEILIVENGSRCAETFGLYDHLKKSPKIRLLEWKEPFNYPAINNDAVRHCRGEVLLFLNNDTEAINADWLDRMLEHALRPPIGAVGAKLHYPDDTIQHAGVILGLGGHIGHAHRHFPGSVPGYMNRLAVVHNVSAVTAACMMMRKAVFLEVGGFEEEYAVAFNDVDLCLKLREKGYRIVWTPHAELYHHESNTRGYDLTQRQKARFLRESYLFGQRWPGILESCDPFYSPHLNPDREDFSLRLRKLPRNRAVA